MTREEKITLLDNLLEIEEKNDFGNFTRSDRAEFQMWVKALEQEPKTGHWIYDKCIQNWKCSECWETPKTMGYVGNADFMKEHFKFCNHCGARMIEVSE